MLDFMTIDGFGRLDAGLCLAIVLLYVVHYWAAGR